MNKGTRRQGHERRPDISDDPDAGSDRSECFDDLLDDEAFQFNEIGQMVRTFERKRIEARRAIERIKEQIALNNDLKDYNDYSI